MIETKLNQIKDLIGQDVVRLFGSKVQMDELDKNINELEIELLKEEDFFIESLNYYKIDNLTYDKIDSLLRDNQELFIDRLINFNELDASNMQTIESKKELYIAMQNLKNSFEINMNFQYETRKKCLKNNPEIKEVYMETLLDIDSYISVAMEIINESKQIDKDELASEILNEEYAKIKDANRKMTAEEIENMISEIKQYANVTIDSHNESLESCVTNKENIINIAYANIDFDQEAVRVEAEKEILH